MTLPSFVLGATIATFLGAVFHLWRGGGLGRLLLYMLLAWLGFWVGHWAASNLGWELFRVGPLFIGFGILGGLGALLGGHWLLIIQPR